MISPGPYVNSWTFNYILFSLFLVEGSDRAALVGTCLQPVSTHHIQLACSCLRNTTAVCSERKKDNTEREEPIFKYFLYFLLQPLRIHIKSSLGFSQKGQLPGWIGRELTNHAAAEILSEAVNLFKDKQNALIASHAVLTDGF